MPLQRGVSLLSQSLWDKRWDLNFSNSAHTWTGTSPGMGSPGRTGEEEGGPFNSLQQQPQGAWLRVGYHLSYFIRMDMRT